MRFFYFAIFLFLSLLALFSGSSISAAQENQAQVYTTRDGLAGDYITALTFAPDDTAWVGTTEGATHIEPQRWTSYTRVHGLGDSWITAIAVAPDQRVWFGTQSGGVSALDPVSKTLTTYNLDNSEIPSNFITELAIDSQNHVWIGTMNDGIAEFDGTSQRWLRHGLARTQITSLFLDRDENPWVTADQRIYVLDQDQWKPLALPLGEEVERVRLTSGRIFADTTSQTHYIREGDSWQLLASAKENIERGNLPQDEQITAFAGRDQTGELWLGTAHGLYTLNARHKPLEPYPVVLIHGWTVAGDDTLETSEFKFLKSYADRDGIPMDYARGVSPKNTLYQNAQVMRDEIARVKKETGADKVNIIAFSMGGMNTRAYLETALYANDVNRAIILGTPQAGVEIWKPILFQQILQKPDEPSAIELSPEYARMVVNQTRAPNPTVPYDLLIGDAREQTGLEFIQDLPASDALISVNSALALDGAHVRKHVNADLHDWSPQAVPLDLTSYLYPRATWERYLRNALRNNDNAPLGSEVLPSPPTPLPSPKGRGVGGEGRMGNHTPVVTEKIRAGETVTRTVLLDENKSARFIAYYPGGKLNFSIIAPDGKTYEPSDLPRADEAGVLSLSTDIASFSGYVVKNAPAGEWQMVLTRTDAGTPALDVSTYVELESPRRVTTGIEPKASGAASPFITVPAPNVKISVRVGIPSAQHDEPYRLVPVPVGGPDEDGRFHPNLPQDTPGWYPVFVTVQGADFERETEFLYAVPSDNITFQSGLPLTVERDANAPNQLVPSSIGVHVKRAGSYALAAQIRDANDKIVARSFTPVTLEAGERRIFFSLLVPDPDAWYTLDLTLYDANWAALPGSSIQANVKFKQSK